LDRFDLVVPICRPSAEDLLSEVPGEPSANVAGRVAAARQRAAARGNEEPRLTAEANESLRQKLREGGLSARGFSKVKRVAQTVADLEGEDVVSYNHVSEALRLRAGRSAVIA
jgi:magnesium chelatase family protein